MGCQNSVTCHMMSVNPGSLNPEAWQNHKPRCWDSGIHMNMEENIIFLQNQHILYYYIVSQNCPETATDMLAANFEDGWGTSKVYGKQKSKLKPQTISISELEEQWQSIEYKNIFH